MKRRGGGGGGGGGQNKSKALLPRKIYQENLKENKKF